MDDPTCDDENARVRVLATLFTFFVALLFVEDRQSELFAASQVAEIDVDIACMNKDDARHVLRRVEV